MQFFQHDVGEEEIKAMGQAVRDGHLTTGKILCDFKRALMNKFNFPSVEICSSGTSALQLALFALGVGPGDEVITTPFVGVWTANTILMNGATPVFADVERRTYNLDANEVEKKLSTKTKVVLPVSVNGVPCDLAILRNRIPKGVRLVCDDIEALGSKRGKRYVGEDIGRDISVGGFWVSKQVTTCCGGMVVSEDYNFLAKFEKLTRHGHGLVGDMWNQSFGFNAWMADPLAAMGIVQLKRFEEKQERLLKVKQMLDSCLDDCRFQRPKSGDFATEFVYIIELPDMIDKKKYTNEMINEGIPTRPYFNSLLEVPHLQKFGYAGDCPIATRLASRTIALPYHWKMTWEDVLKIAKAHETVCERLIP